MLSQISRGRPTRSKLNFQIQVFRNQSTARHKKRTSSSNSNLFVCFLDTTYSQLEHSSAQKRDAKHQFSFGAPKQRRNQALLSIPNKETKKGLKWVELASAHSDAMQMCFYPQRLREGLCSRTLAARCVRRGSSKLRCTRSLCVADTHLSQLA